MAKYLQRILILLFGVFGRHPGPSDAGTVAVAKPKPPVDSGHFYFRDTVLDQLHVYFKLLRTMRKGDREAYNYFSKIGGQIIPARHALPYFSAGDKELSPWWIANRPASGGIFIGADSAFDKVMESEEVWWPRAVYFHKYDRGKAPYDVQRIPSGDIYLVSVYWAYAGDNAPKHVQRAREGSATQFAIGIDKDNAVRVLKIRERDTVTVRGKHGQSRGKNIYIPRDRWCINDFYHSWAKEHETTAEAYLKGLFVDTANLYEAANSGMAQVRVKRGALACIFTLDILRTPYFFKDREVRVASDGRQKRIFHIVRTHPRVIKGKTVHVKSHFRGLRKFDWNSYKIQISVPGWHHYDLTEFDIAGADEEFVGEKESIGQGELASRLLQWEEDGMGGVHKSTN